jgi:predicted metal-binding membrane protein
LSAPAEPPRAGRGGFASIAWPLVAVSWAALLLWGQSPYGRYLEHGRWTDAGAAAIICRGLPAGDLLLPAMLYAGGWALMTAAMMMPAAMPLFARFERVVANRPDRRRLAAAVILGYLAAWLGFGLLAHGLDMAVHAAMRRSQWLLFNGWALGAAVLAVAGIFQFSSLKYRCLTRCRAPFSFIAAHWRGPAPLRNAFRLGLDHGVFCVGCCWALMLLMFAVGTGNVGWMLGLGALMAVEKNLPWSRHLSRALGAALLAAAALVAGLNLTA